MENPFEVLQQQLAQIQIQLAYLTQNKPVVAEEEAILNAEQAATFMNISKGTLYDNIRSIPHQKKFGKLYFFKLELLAYLKGEFVVSQTTGKLTQVHQKRRTRKRKITDE